MFFWTQTWIILESLTCCGTNLGPDKVYNSCAFPPMCFKLLWNLVIHTHWNKYFGGKSVLQHTCTKGECNFQMVILANSWMVKGWIWSKGQVESENWTSQRTKWLNRGSNLKKGYRQRKWNVFMVFSEYFGDYSILEKR